METIKENVYAGNAPEVKDKIGDIESVEHDAQVPIITCENESSSSSRSVENQNKTKNARQLEDLMMHKTILFMDYRRLRRRFNGIRQPFSYKKALFIAFFCLCLALVPFIYFRQEETKYVVSIEIKRGARHYISYLLLVIVSFLLARIQLSIPFKWPIAISYAFMFATLIIMIVLKHVIDFGEFVWLSLTVYTIVQISVIVLTRIVIWLGPLLALNGLFFPCTEHFHLFERTRRGSNLNITISRYNDYSVMCGANGCGLCTCIYRVSYRWIRWLLKKLIATDGITKGDTPFSHQMRYRGEIDENELPHGYGEWLEDDGYGERLQGYWWHGYPIGPFTSQEIGSGSIFANTRVAFITDTRKESGKVRYGVSSTECSMSGNFFREFPLTYFFNPLYNDKHHYNPGGFYKNCKFFNVLHDRFADLQGASFKWCVRMLRSQFFLNMPTNASTITVYVDKLSKSLRLNGYKQTGDASETKSCDEIRIKLTTQKGGGMLTRLNQINENVNQTTGAAESVSSSSLSNDECEEDKESGDGNPAKLNSLSSGFLKVNNNRGLLNVPHPVRGRDGISRLFLDEDDWEDQVNSSAPQFLVEGWAPIRSFGKIGCIADQAVIYIHGYNVSLQEACSQMAHIVAFSKLPPYVLPFVFNWDGQHWGRFGALAYRKARNITQHPGLEESFCELLNELGNMGIKHLHIIAHSCGARVFFKVFRAAIQKKLLLQVLGSNKPTFDGKQGQIGSTKTTSSTPIRIDTLMLLNPDFPMKKFRDHDYFVVRSYCDHIVMYVDTRDHCLTMAELHNGEESLGMSVFGMCTTPEILDEVVPELEAAGISLSLPKNQMAAEIAFLSNYTMYKSKATLARPSHLDGGVFSIDMPSGEGSSAVKRETVSNSVISPSPIDVLYNTMSKSSEVMQSYNLPRLSDDLGVESRHLWLDMDVIDTTMIDTNVDFLKHSLYQMKREIMDDLREVILMKIRADQRHTRLDRRRGNVFVFRVAPAAVNHLFRGP